MIHGRLVALKFVDITATASGWFDGGTFEEWVRTIIYSYFKDKPGKNILIGDNL
jgi:hypothetical protein